PDPAIVLEQSVQWFDRYLRGNHNVDTGPGFRWLSDTGVLHGAAAYPPPRGAPLTGSGSGTLAMVAGDTSGLLVAATKAANAVNRALAQPATGTRVPRAPPSRPPARSRPAPRL